MSDYFTKDWRGLICRCLKINQKPSPNMFTLALWRKFVQTNAFQESWGRYRTQVRFFPSHFYYLKCNNKKLLLIFRYKVSLVVIDRKEKMSNVWQLQNDKVLRNAQISEKSLFKARTWARHRAGLCSSLNQL